VNQSFQPVASVRGSLQRFHGSLQSGATAHTVKPSLPAGEATGTLDARRKSSINLVLLGMISAALGLTGATRWSHLDTRTPPVMQIVSGSPVLKKSSDGESVRWHASKATVYLDSSLDALGGQARDAVQVGFGTWISSGAKLPALSFDSTQGATFGSPDGKSEIMYGPITIPGHEDNLALTITFSNAQTGEVLESDMIFNSTHSYGMLTTSDPIRGSTTTASVSVGSSTSAATCDDKYDLQSVATHEVGHFFGLGEDFDVKTATMYYTTGRCETNKRALHASDETTIDALYVASDGPSATDGSTDTGKGCGGARIGLGKTGGNASLLSLAGLLGLVAFRRRQR
jgi:hypothetical protein